MEEWPSGLRHCLGKAARVAIPSSAGSNPVSSAKFNAGLAQSEERRFVEPKAVRSKLTPSAILEGEYQMSEMMKQCRLVRTDGATQVSWIQAEFAKQGRSIELKENGVWEGGWAVSEAFDPVIAADVIRNRERDFKNHRKATDV